MRAVTQRREINQTKPPTISARMMLATTKRQINQTKPPEGGPWALGNLIPDVAAVLDPAFFAKRTQFFEENEAYNELMNDFRARYSSGDGNQTTER